MIRLGSASVGAADLEEGKGHDVNPQRSQAIVPKTSLVTPRRPSEQAKRREHAEKYREREAEADEPAVDPQIETFLHRTPERIDLKAFPHALPGIDVALQKFVKRLSRAELRH